MKKYLILILILLTRTISYGQIVWDFTYTDSAGTGFNDTSQGAARQAALQEAGNLISSWLGGYSATIKMNISSTVNSSSGSPFANSSVLVSGASGFNKTIIQTKIQTNGSTDSNGSAADGNISFNFFYNWSFSNSVTSSQYDFKSMALRQLTRSLGFVSAITEDGSGYGNLPSGSIDGFTYFDQFLVTSTGAPLVILTNSSDTSTTAFDTNVYSYIFGNNTLGSTVGFSGSNAASTYGSNIPIYTPDVWEDGKSLSSLNDSSFFPNALMEADLATGLQSRSWNNVEKAILTDLGYTITAIPEPHFVIGFGLLALLLSFFKKKPCAK